MSRTLKRVPLDFSWPKNEIWKGYINPHYKATKCPDCENGYSREYDKLLALWYHHKGGNFRPEMRGSVPFNPDDELVVKIITQKINRDLGASLFYGTDDKAIHREAVRMCEIWNTSWSHHLNEQDVAALIEANRLFEFTSTFVQGEGWKLKEPAYIPTPKQVNEWSLSGFSHDSCNCWIVLKAELKRLGLPSTCSTCNGEGDIWKNEEDRKTYDEWKDFEPPIGEGFQLWETCSEGSPQSPVFKTITDLCEWCETNATTFGSSRATSEQWRKMLDEDFVHHQEGNMIFM